MRIERSQSIPSLLIRHQKDDIRPMAPSLRGPRGFQRSILQEGFHGRKSQTSSKAGLDAFLQKLSAIYHCP